MNGITWLHLSDWHQRGEEFGRKIVLARLLTDIREREGIDSNLKKIDFLFFTGDLTYSGKPEEFLKAKTFLLEPLLESIGISQDRLFIVPGNHDLDRQFLDIHRKDILKLMQEQKNIEDWLTNDRKRRNVLEPFGDYAEFISQYLGKHHHRDISDKYQFAYSLVRKMEIAGQKIVHRFWGHPLKGTCQEKKVSLP